jgi:hypothetical protein
MLVSSYSQTDEVSFEINLKDSVFANAGQLNLKIPQGFGSGGQLESSHGEICLLRLYKRQNSGESISQGVKRDLQAVFTPELEQGSNASEILTTFDGKPSFVKNFTVSEVLNADTGQPARISVRTSAASINQSSPIRNPEFSGTEGNCIEIVAGRGKGNLYRVTNVEPEDSGRKVITLDKPVRTGDILCRSDVKISSLGRIPAISKKYGNSLTDAIQFRCPAITQTFMKGSDDETSLEDISVFRFVSGSNRYAVPLMRNVRPMPYPQYLYNTSNSRSWYEKYNVRAINDNGTFHDARTSINVIESNEKYSVIEFPKASGDNITVTETGKYQPRWDTTPAASGFQTKGDRPAKEMLPENGALVASGLEKVAECSGGGTAGLHIALYWRIDDLHFSGKYKIRPRFSFRMDNSWHFSARALLIDDAGNAIAVKNYNLDLDDGKYVEDDNSYPSSAKISLTGNEAEANGERLEKAQKLLERLKNLLVFDSETEAKYIYLQLFFDANSTHPLLYFSASPVECEREIELGKVFLRGEWGNPQEIKKWGIVGQTEQLCSDYGIKTDEQSFKEVSDKIPNELSEKLEDYECKMSFIPFKHGEKFADKLAEICRAANFSMFSNGSMLYAKYFLSSEQGWSITSADIIKGSLEVRGIGLDSVASEWDFSANVHGVQKTLSMETSSQFPDTAEWLPADEPFSAESICPGYMQNEPLGIGARVNSENSKKLYIGGIYKIRTNSGKFVARCELASVRMDETGADALFVVVQQIPLQSRAEISHIVGIEITPLKQEFNWREIVSGTLDIGIASAGEFHEISKAAFEKTKHRIKLDERYTKHNIAAFGTDEHWLQSFINTARHNSYAKTIVSFKVPLDCLLKESFSGLMEGSLSSLLLKRITLAFGRFRNNTLDGWIVGYSLAPAEDAVRIEFINSEPVKDVLFLDENILEGQKTIDEREPVQEFYSER